MILGKTLLSVIRISLTLLLACVIIGVLMIVWYLSTPEGTREFANILQTEVEDLSIDLSSGVLAKGLDARHILYKHKTFRLEASNAKGQWRSSCLLGARLCIEKLQLERLEIRLFNSGSASNQPAKLPEKIVLPLDIKVDSLSIDELYITPANRDEAILITDVELQANNKGHTIELIRLSARYQQHRLTGSGQIGLENDFPLQLKTDAFINDLYQDQDLNLSADIQGDLEELNLDVFAFGPITANINGYIRPLDKNLPLNLQISAIKNTVTLTNAEPITLENTQIHLQGDTQKLDTRISTRINSARIPGSSIDLSGKLDRNSFTANDIEVNALQGLIKGQAKVEWINNLQWTSSLYFKELNPSGLHSEFPGNLGGVLQTNGSVDTDGKVQFQISPAVLQGELREYPLHMHSVLSFEDNVWHIDSLRLSSQENNLEIAGTIDDHWQVDGDLTLTTLEKLLPKTHGEVSGSFAVRGETLTPDVGFTFKSPKLTYENYHARKITIEADINALGVLPSSIDLKANSVLSGSNEFKNPVLQVRGTRMKHKLSLTGAGPEQMQLVANILGRLEAGNQWTGQLQQSALKVRSERITQITPASLTLDTNQQTLVIGEHCWNSDGSSLCMDNKATVGKHGQVQVKLNNVELSRFNDYLNNTKLKGAGDLNLQAQWNIEKPENNQLSVNAVVKNGIVSSHHKNGQQQFIARFDSINITTLATDKSIRINADVQSKQFGRGQIDAVLDPRSRPVQISQSKLQLTDFNIGFLTAFLPEVDEIGGTLSAYGTLSGPVSQPLFNGQVELDKTRFVAIKSPININGGKLVLRVQGNNLLLNGQLSSASGQLLVEGNGQVTDLNNYDATLRISSKNLDFEQKPLVEAKLIPDLILDFKPESLRVGGKIKIDRASINIKSIPEDATATSPDVYIITEKDDEEENPNRLKISTDIDVVLGNQVRLSGYGLKARLTGDLKIKKSHEETLQFFGEIDIPEGIYKSYGQDLTIERGQVFFVGPLSQTTLDIEAFRLVDTVKAGLELTGTVTNPIINLNSIPVMEQERILGFIVLGRDISTSNETGDSSVLATAALSMGISNGRGLATRIAETFGVRDFNIEAAGRGEDTQVMLSGRLSSKLMVRYGIGVFTPVNTLFLRYDLGKQLYVETAQGLESAVDIFYSIAF